MGKRTKPVQIALEPLKLTARGVTRRFFDQTRAPLWREEYGSQPGTAESTAEDKRLSD